MSDNVTPKRKVWTRNRTTRKSVVVADILSKAVITGGGVGTIIAVLGVCLFLVWVALPLFRTAEVSGTASFTLSTVDAEAVATGIDEYQVLGWMLQRNGVLRAFHTETGEETVAQHSFTNGAISGVSRRIGSDELVLGFTDGTLVLADLGFETSFLSAENVDPEVRDKLDRLPAGKGVQSGEGVIQLTPEGQYRRQQLRVREVLQAKIGDTPILRITHGDRSDGKLICVLAEKDGIPRLAAIPVTKEESFLTGKVSLTVEAPVELPLRESSRGSPVALALSARASDLYVAWANGHIERVRCTDLDAPFIAESGRLFEDEASITDIGFIIGYTTLAWGDSKGRIGTGFLVRLNDMDRERGLVDVERDQARTSFGFARSHDIAGPDAVGSLASSSRSRLLACGYGGGQVRVFNATSGGEVAALQVPSREPVLSVAITPKEDGLIAYTGTSFFHCQLDPRHPETDMTSLFRPVWYEGYAAPQHIWQSSSATDDFEPKYGLMPLIFGTVKATVYSMLFGAPLAFLAAIFSSEFLRPRVKALVKPTVELMASLPSVVLGFLAALVFAPVVEQIIPAVLAVFVTVPVALLLGAYLWQLLPPRISMPLADWRFVVMLVPIGLGIWWAQPVGDMMERVFFVGDLKAWLSWDAAREDPATEIFRSSTGGWMLLWLPLSALIVALASGRFVNPHMRRLSHRADRFTLALVDIGKFVGTLVMVVAMAWGMSSALSMAGFDPRGSYLGTYVQRNSLVVGIVMGFAIIPIIYTLSDDALSTVPGHLRGASLGAGATRWQTAVRVVIPTAMSGLFSALMIGLGRAVGETMIVLMAAGNTPIMSWNIFEGFRTLSANIAVELPEAVKDSTHYRTLFLAALVLFAMTFVVNTVAELVRLRFRKRAVSL